MDAIKQFLKLLSREALIELCASLMFSTLVNAVTLVQDLSKLEKGDKK